RASAADNLTETPHPGNTPGKGKLLDLTSRRTTAVAKIRCVPRPTDAQQYFAGAVGHPEQYLPGADDWRRRARRCFRIVPLLFFCIAFVMGLGAGAPVLIGQAYGAGELEKVKAVAG